VRRSAAGPTAPAGHAAPSGPAAQVGLRVAAPLQGLPPLADAHARLLVLGSFPGRASLQLQQYYAHPRNQFWPIVGTLLGIDLAALPYAERSAAARRLGLAVWDVYRSCQREGSLDTAIRDPEPNDLAALVARLPGLRGIAHNGGESARAMRVTARLGLPVYRLPSTSPAHASWSLSRKLQAWQQVFEACGLGPGATVDPDGAR
jgi:hypoxanthine-DNA glycosylase